MSRLLRAELLGVLLPLVIPTSLVAQTSGPDITPVPALEVLAQEPPTREGALFLLLPSGAQGVGLGRAMTSMVSSEAAFWNPAGLAGLESSRLLLTRGEHLGGEATGLSALWARDGGSSFGFSYQMLDQGTQEATDGEGNVRGSIVFRNHQALLSAATTLGSRTRVGITTEMVMERTTGRGDCGGILDRGVTATGYAVDLGLQARPLRDHPLELGVMIAHLGPKFRVEGAEQSDPLPARVRLGIAYDVLHDLVDEDFEMKLILEGEDRLLDPGNGSAYLGAEFSAGTEDRVFLRGGYVFSGNPTDGAALGFGFRYERFEFGLARALARGGLTTGDEPVHITLGFVL
jgi:hypothetical protein